MRLLLAEPTKAIGELVSFICLKEGVECDVARDVDTLFLFLNEEEYDVICLAPNIDADDGIDVLLNIRALPQFAFIPIFIITSSNNPDLVRRALSSGATDIIEKSDFESLEFFINRFKRSEKPLKAKVLVVEDSLTQQLLLTTLLENIGCSVDCFDNGEEAFNSFLKQDYDLVITDILLKGDLSGVALAGRIRRLNSVRGDVPIIAITAFDENSRQESLFRYGVSDYLKKPIDSVNLTLLSRNLIISFKNHKKLEKNRAELSTSDSQREKFWMNMSHEILSPLNGVIGSLQLIQAQDVAEPKQSYLSDAKNASQILLSLMNHISDMTQTEMNENNLLYRMENIKNIVKRVLSNCEDMAIEKKLDLSCVFAKDLPQKIECDGLRLEQVLSSLVENALKCTEKGKVVIKSILDKKLKVIVFKVIDTGIGLTESDKSMVFFEMTRKSKSVEHVVNDPEGNDSATKSTLSLQIIKSIITIWGGDIGVDSKYGEGSEFWFTIPIKNIERQSSSLLLKLDCEDPETKKILYVEHNDVKLMLAKKLFTSLGIQVDSTDNGANALNMLNQNDYDCAFIDCQMPILNGFEIAEMYRSQTDKNEALPIIALSSLSSKAFKKQCLIAGMNGFLKKPMNKRDLIFMLNQYLV